MVRDAPEEVEAPEPAQENINWRARLRKWKNGIDSETVTTPELQEFLETKLYEYTKYRLHDKDLWDTFQEDFEGITTPQLATVDRQDLKDIRHCLRCGGVYVEQNNRNLTIPQSLVNVL